MSRKTHGGKGTREYTSWLNMRQRCLNPHHPNYHSYGARGISICNTWDSFAIFLADMGARPIGASLERKDNNKGYSKTNCIWATPTQQVRNRRNTNIVSAFGRTQPLACWSAEIGISYTTLSWRLHHGWTPEKALTKEVGKQHG